MRCEKTLYILGLGRLVILFSMAEKIMGILSIDSSSIKKRMCNMIHLSSCDFSTFSVRPFFLYHPQDLYHFLEWNKVLLCENRGRKLPTKPSFNHWVCIRWQLFEDT